MRSALFFKKTQVSKLLLTILIVGFYSSQTYSNDNTDSSNFTLQQYFLKPAAEGSNLVTKYLRSNSTIIYDSNPCLQREFYSHITTPAHTLAGGRFAYEPFPGARFDSFLLNSLSIGLWKGLQIGTIPAFHMTDDEPNQNPDGTSSQHTSNFNFKWTMFSFKNFDAALAWSGITFRNIYSTPLVLPSGTYDRTNIYIRWITLVMNYYFESLPLALGINFSSVYISSDTKELDELYRKQNTSSERVYELSYLFRPNWAVTTAVGFVKDTVFEFEKAYFSYGASISYIRHTKWFNKFSFGVHRFNEIDTEKFVFSFSL